jgi:hypothetical protein
MHYNRYTKVDKQKDDDCSFGSNIFLSSLIFVFLSFLGCTAGVALFPLLAYHFAIVALI